MGKVDTTAQDAKQAKALAQEAKDEAKEAKSAATTATDKMGPAMERMDALEAEFKQLQAQTQRPAWPATSTSPGRADRKGGESEEKRGRTISFG
eukprot:7209617-Pyramimonas_sp.AAC.1